MWVHSHVQLALYLNDAAQERLPQNGILDHEPGPCQGPLGQGPWANQNLPIEINPDGL